MFSRIKHFTTRKIKKRLKNKNAEKCVYIKIIKKVKDFLHLCILPSIFLQNVLIPSPVFYPLRFLMHFRITINTYWTPVVPDHRRPMKAKLPPELYM